LYDRVAEATADGAVVPVHCFPFRMTVENLTLHAESEWIPFWQWELAPAYLWFEETRRVPVVDEAYRLV
jgi:murein L,D-transpeptidase YafK